MQLKVTLLYSNAFLKLCKTCNRMRIGANPEGPLSRRKTWPFRICFFPGKACLTGKTYLGHLFFRFFLSFDLLLSAGLWE
jgi:hypothetical protein